MRADNMNARALLDNYIYLKSMSESNIDLVDYVIDIENALDKLSERYRFILEKIHVEGYQQKEVAEMLHVTKSTLNGVYKNALKEFERYYSYD